MAASPDAWSRVHALGMLGSAGIALAAGRPWLLSAWILASLGAFAATSPLAAGRRAGLANGVTALRLVLVASLGALPFDAPGHLLAGLVALIFALDGLDGLIARRSGTASQFGAAFDMEADAAFVLAAGLVLCARGDLAPWILVPGALRYVYVLALWIVPARSEEVSRSRLGRFAFAGGALGLIAAFALPGRAGAWLAFAGSLGIALSFARSFFQVYRRPRLN